MALIKGIEKIDIRTINYKGVTVKEFDLNKALLRKPEVILVDELAHTNIEAKRHRKDGRM